MHHNSPGRHYTVKALVLFAARLLSVPVESCAACSGITCSPWTETDTFSTREGGATPQGREHEWSRCPLACRRRDIESIDGRHFNYFAWPAWPTVPPSATDIVPLQRRRDRGWASDRPARQPRDRSGIEWLRRRANGEGSRAIVLQGRWAADAIFDTSCWRFGHNLSPGHNVSVPPSVQSPTIGGA